MLKIKNNILLLTEWIGMFRKGKTRRTVKNYGSLFISLQKVVFDEGSNLRHVSQAYALGSRLVSIHRGNLKKFEKNHRVNCGFQGWRWKMPFSNL